jgi:ADP-dependent NAD(P)H-hydrate dehydratase / NAD(P)H-hydrate epimerase
MSDDAGGVRPFARGVTLLPTGPEATEFDRWAIEELGIPEAALMEAAGRSAADVLTRLFPDGEVVVLAGAGNNGGDALVLARTLAARGRRVKVILVADRSPDDPLLHGWAVPVVPDAPLHDAASWANALSGAGVLVDGILGTGIRGAPRERQAYAIEALNAQTAPVLALDLPSGVDSVTGAVPADAVRAAVTVAFGWPKLGAALSPGREYAGRSLAVEIGFPPAESTPILQAAITPTWAASLRPGRAPDTHKNEVGSLLLVGGRTGMAGAVILAGRAAIRAGVGFLRIASLPANREALQTAIPEAVFVDLSQAEAVLEAAASSRALAIGPGLGTDDGARSALEIALSGEFRPRVLDADALNLIAAGRGPSLAAIGARGTTLLTPHPGEMRRLVRGPGASSVDSPSELPATLPLEQARSLAAVAQVSVLLKGMPSVVVRPDGHALVDTVVTSDLAQAGMGDVLTGVAGAFMAQGSDAQAAGGLALYHVGRAAARAGRGAGMSAEDVIDALPQTLTERGPGESELDLPCLLFDVDAAR